MAKVETLVELNSQLAKVDMQRAEILKKLKANPQYVLAYLKERATLIIGNFYQTQNLDVVYSVNSIDVKKITEKEVVINSSSTTKTRYIKSVDIKKKKIICDEYCVVLTITKYNRDGSMIEDGYVLLSPEMPRDVDKWLTIGNSKIDANDAKIFINMAIQEEIKKHEAKVKELKAKLK